MHTDVGEREGCNDIDGVDEGLGLIEGLSDNDGDGLFENHAKEF